MRPRGLTVPDRPDHNPGRLGRHHLRLGPLVQHQQAHAASADGHPPKPRPTTTLTTVTASRPFTRNEGCIKPRTLQTSLKSVWPKTLPTPAETLRSIVTPIGEKRVHNLHSV